MLEFVCIYPHLSKISYWGYNAPPTIEKGKRRSLNANICETEKWDRIQISEDYSNKKNKKTKRKKEDSGTNNQSKRQALSSEEIEFMNK